MKVKHYIIHTNGLNLSKKQGLKKEIYEIVDDNEIVGYLPGFRIKKDRLTFLVLRFQVGQHPIWAP